MIDKERHFLIELHQARLYSELDAVEIAINNLHRKPTRQRMETLVAVWTKAQLALWEIEPKEAA